MFRSGWTGKSAARWDSRREFGGPDRPTVRPPTEYSNGCEVFLWVYEMMIIKINNADFNALYPCYWVDVVVVVVVLDSHLQGR